MLGPSVLSIAIDKTDGPNLHIHSGCQIGICKCYCLLLKVQHLISGIQHARAQNAIKV